MARQTGIPSLLQVAERLCLLIFKFSPIIRVVTNNDTAVMLALETALAACDALAVELRRYREEGD